MAMQLTKMNSKRNVSMSDILHGFKPNPARGVSVKEAVSNSGFNFGRLTGLTGSPGSGKSTFIRSLGWLNLRYKKHLDNDITGVHFPKVIKLLQKGIIPEVTKMGIIETDMKDILDFRETEWSKKFGPLIDDDVFQLTEIYIIPSKEMKGKKTYDVVMLEEEKTEFESAAVNYMKDDDYQIVAIDNASDYAMALEGEASTIYDESWDIYGARKRWMLRYLTAAKAAKKPQYLVFRLQERLDFMAKKYAETGNYDHMFEEPWYKIEWPGKGAVGYKLDNFFLFKRNIVTNKFIVKQKKGAKMYPPELIMPDDPFPALYVLEACADSMLGEYDKDKFEKGEKFW